jgi:hypothetical protein
MLPTISSVGPALGVAGATCTYADINSFGKIVISIAMLLAGWNCLPCCFTQTGILEINKKLVVKSLFIDFILYYN